MKASFIIPCKGRLSHLKETLDDKLNQKTELDFEIIVVDYTCPDDTFKFCSEHPDSRLRCVRVFAQDDYFNNSHARNCGARVAEGDILCFSDADCHLSDKWLEYVRFNMDYFPNADGFGNDIVLGDGQLGRGTWAVTKRLWYTLRGYDETMESWGTEELDFFWRMKKFGSILTFPRNMAWTIAHSDELRLRFYNEKSKYISNSINRCLLNTRKSVNPNGFGQLTRNLTEHV
jgi:glycosyltransferase involved in cell wall biosynthesis